GAAGASLVFVPVPEVRCSLSMVPPKLSPANAGLLCVLDLIDREHSGRHGARIIPTEWLAGWLGDRMKRREFITLLGGAAAAWPLVARAQQTPRPPATGFLNPTTTSVANQQLAAFVERLRAVGWIEGRNVAIKVRWAEGRSERAAAIVAEFVRQKVDVVVLRGSASVPAAREATSVIPIVFAGGDPVGTGLVVTLARSGGDVTGVSLQQ